MNEPMVTVRRQDLLDRIRANRENHRAMFLSALDGYRDAILADLESALEQVKAGKLPDVRIQRSRPADHTREYDNIITMFEMATTDDVQVNQEQVSCFVNDDWEWQRQWGISNASYTDTSSYTGKFAR